jgi:hypothetical protein
VKLTQKQRAQLKAAPLEDRDDLREEWKLEARIRSLVSKRSAVSRTVARLRRRLEFMRKQRSEDRASRQEAEAERRPIKLPPAVHWLVRDLDHEGKRAYPACTFDERDDLPDGEEMTNDRAAVTCGLCIAGMPAADAKDGGR